MSGDVDDPIADPAVVMLGRPHAWEFVRRFMGAWMTPLGDGDGCTDAELDAASDRLGRSLPVALREAYRLLGRRPDLTNGQDKLLAPHQWELEHGDLLVYRRENQNCAVWAVDLADPAQADPPTLYREIDQGDWRPFLSRFSDACVEMVLSEAVLGGAVELSLDRQPDDASLAILESTYRRLDFPEYELWAAPDGPSVRWFAGPAVLLCDHAQTWLWVQARTPEAIDEVRRQMPGEWTEH
jgi:hypothetical protein